MRQFEKNIVPGAAAYVDRLVLGQLATNVYAIHGILGTVLIDPACDAPVIIEALGTTVPDAILITHYHWDHVGAAAELRDHYGIPVIASAVDAPLIEEGPIGFGGIAAPPCPVDVRVHEGDVVSFGTLRFTVMETPGHSLGSVCYWLEGTVEPGAESMGKPILVSGDTLFCGTIGRTDFADSDPEAMVRSLEKLTKLPDATQVLPGHDSMTTIGAERERVFQRFCR